MSKTWAEVFDAAEDGPQFGAVLQGLFRAVEQAMDEDDDE